jgi:hypothetical protein
MQHYNNIDELFRDRFSNFEVEPPERVWRNVSRTISSGPGINPGWMMKGGIWGLSVVVILLSVLSYHQVSRIPTWLTRTADREITTIQAPAAPAMKFMVRAGIPAPERAPALTHLPGNTSPARQETGIIEAPEVNPPAAQSTYEESNEVPGITPPVDNEKQPGPVVTESQPDQTTLSANARVAYPDLALLSTRGFDGRFYASLPDAGFRNLFADRFTASLGTLNWNKTFFGVSAPLSSRDYGMKPEWFVGLYITPELIYHPSDEGNPKHSYAIELNSTYQLRGFFVQGGVGIALSNDNAACSIDYERYEFLGSYEDLIEITFDTTGGNVVPIYHTQTVDVYDSIRHVSISQAKNRYTYLQIPLLFGMNRDMRKISWSVKAGPSISFLVHEGTPDLDLPYRDIKVINLENSLPRRIEHFWQALFALGISYKLSNTVSLNIEPTFKYYINSAYERPYMTTRHPYSLALRAGFMLKMK